MLCMRLLIVAAVVCLGCHRQSASATVAELPLVDPLEFGKWPSVTKQPIETGPALWRLCRAPISDDERNQKSLQDTEGPHAGYSIVLRVSPNASKSFHDGEN